MDELDIQQELNSAIPAECISTRKGGGGVELSYVSGRYVFEELNRIFGYDGWSFEIREFKLLDHDRAFCHVTLTILEKAGKDPWGSVSRDGVAIGYGRSGNEGFDFACAEAVTDAVKRAAKCFGGRLGLELYPMTSGGKRKKAASPRRTKRVDPDKAAAKLVDMLHDRIRRAETSADMTKISTEIRETNLSKSQKDELRAAFITKKEELIK